ncbi:sugar nucleotide-binding protein [Microbacterium sp. NM3R9]|uniref:sugar nucleotide-binding protein n=1 Tax=Microbacterium thalli TaxID=3027921 RepID=UPI0023658761|nr:sugar nucleotide-binding protein [Microbacterium thalli]MDD7928841.1 sugar nucleotide-binding protein [Microbacterium thalli]MDN8547767.1 sugar nucleotide-binding protein [Microbacterium thalli]
MTARRILLVGSGKVGSSLGERLVAAGDEVVAIRRSAGGIRPAFTPIVADLSRPLDAALPSVDAMVMTLPPGDDPRFYRTALERLAAALPAVPARTVFVSSTRVFEGWDAERPLDETDEPRPTSERGEQLVDGERAAVELFDAVVVRPAGIYGPGRERLIRQVLAGEPVDHDRRTNRIHEADLVRALETLLRAEDPPALLHGVDRRPATLGEVVAFIAQRLGVAAPPRAEVDPDARRGTILDGARLAALVPELEFPTFVEGYGRVIADRA